MSPDKKLGHCSGPWCGILKQSYNNHTKTSNFQDAPPQRTTLDTLTLLVLSFWVIDEIICLSGPES